MVVAKNVRKMMAIDLWAKPRRSVMKHHEAMSRNSRPSRDQSFALHQANFVSLGGVLLDFARKNKRSTG